MTSDLTMKAALKHCKNMYRMFHIYFSYSIYYLASNKSFKNSLGPRFSTRGPLGVCEGTAEV